MVARRTVLVSSLSMRMIRGFRSECSEKFGELSGFGPARPLECVGVETGAHVVIGSKVPGVEVRRDGEVVRNALRLGTAQFSRGSVDANAGHLGDEKAGDGI